MPKPLIENNKEVSFDIGADRLKQTYNYPEGINLEPDGVIHRKILKELMKNAKDSYAIIQDRFSTWKEIDQKLSVYIDLTKEDQRTKNDDESKPVSIVVPVAYATRESLLTYWVAAFLNNPPINRYEPSKDPNDTLGVLLLENIIQQQMVRSKAALDYHTMWSDAFSYGLGGVATSWKVEYGYRTRNDIQTDTILGVPIRRRSVRTRESVINYEGNELNPIDPYNTLPDPNVPITKVQSGEFFGWSERSNLHKLLLDEQFGDGEVFNVKYLELMQDKTSSFYYDAVSDSGRYSKQGINFPGDKVTGNICDKLHFYKWLTPSEYGLGEGEIPELWYFVVVADRIIIEARPLGLDHNQIPVGMMSPDSDGHVSLPVSILEREYPLQHAIDWLWKSHVANVRKAVNNMFVVDPSLINTEDVTDTKFGMLARLRPSAWGRGVREAIEQLQVQDVTKGHIQDIGFLMNIDSLVFTSDQAKGVQQRKGERVSAQEARDTRLSFLSKMEKNAKMGAIQAHQDIAYQLAANTIQLLEREQYVKITGDYRQRLIDEYGVDTRFVKVDPQYLDVRYDVIPTGGTIEGGEFSSDWVQLLQLAGQNPDIYQNLDFTRVFKHVARLLGAKNVDEFMKRPITSNVETSDNIDKQVQAGNYAPVDQAQEVF